MSILPVVVSSHSNSPSKIEFIARGLLVRDDCVLVCVSKAGGYCYLPGGHVDPGESASDACKREFIEETGLDVTVGECLLVNELLFRQGGKPRQELTVVFHVEHAGWGEGAPPPVPSLEDHLKFEWVPLASVVDLDLRPECQKAWIASGGVVDSGVSGPGPLGSSGTGWLSQNEFGGPGGS